MVMCEKRYAKKIIGEFAAKRILALRFGGNAHHFDRLILRWKIYLRSLSAPDNWDSICDDSQTL